MSRLVQVKFKYGLKPMVGWVVTYEFPTLKNAKMCAIRVNSENYFFYNEDIELMLI